MTTILVIEDEPTVRTLLLKLLTAENFNPISAQDGETGVQMAEEQAPDLIICDVMMPKMNGFEVLKRLRQNPATASIPFIFLTAKGEKTDLRQGMDLGADDYLTKPFTRADVLGAIAARLEKQSAITQPYLTELKRAAEHLNQMAYRDPLTQLPNRILLHHRLLEVFPQAKRNQQQVAVVCLNLDRFKAINTSLGQSRGDLLLEQVAERLKAIAGEQNLVARLGGDEFSVVLEALSQPEEASALTQKILNKIAEPYTLDGHYIQIQASAGVSFFPDHGSMPDRLLLRAELAMRHAKRHTPGKFVLYDPQIELKDAEKQLIADHLSRALEHSEFQLYFQPQVKLITGRIIGVEALLRWKSPQLGWVSPDKFISVAEEMGSIIPIGNWALRTACQQAKTWQSATQIPIRVSVNLSARQFKQQDLVATVSQILEETGLPADLLVLELTETSVMENVDMTIDTLNALRQKGVHISIDDFGTGYSSLNYLKRFPIDTLKIDQSFVQDIAADNDDAAIAKAIIAMAQSLQLRVVAEGVETRSQYDFLRHNGCYAMQGYLFSPAVSATEFEQLLKDDKRL